MGEGVPPLLFRRHLSTAQTRSHSPRAKRGWGHPRTYVERGDPGEIGGAISRGEAEIGDDVNPPSPRLRRTSRCDESRPYQGRGCPDRRHRDCDKCGGVSIRSQRRGHPRTWDWGGNGLIPVRTSTEHRGDHTRHGPNGGGATPAPMWKEATPVRSAAPSHGVNGTMWKFFWRSPLRLIREKKFRKI